MSHTRSTVGHGRDLNIGGMSHLAIQSGSGNPQGCYVPGEDAHEPLGTVEHGIQTLV